MGRIYSLNNHGAVVYLTSSENAILITALIVGFSLFILAIIVDRYLAREGVTRDG
jgi:hypothetical protein